MPLQNGTYPSPGELLAALEALSRGLKKLSQPGGPRRPAQESYLKLLFLQSGLSANEQDLVLAAAHWRARGLSSARQRDFRQAAELLREARNVYTRASASRQCLALCESFQAGGEAYLDYCLKDFDSALDRINAAMVMDAALETEAGYGLLHLHRVQLVHNMIRINARRGHGQEALHMAWGMLSYLEGTQQVFSGPAAWDIQMITRAPADLLRVMFDQIVAEIAMIIAGSGPDRWPGFMAAAASHLEAESGSACCRFPAAHLWLKLKTLFFEDRRSFLIQCCDFLDDRDLGHPALWFAVAVDLVAVCKDLDLHRAQVLALDLASEPMPPAFENALAKLMNDDEGTGLSASDGPG